VIVVETAGALRVVTQPDHAHFAAELLSLWRRDGLPQHPRRDDILFAAREHDNGWREADAAPRLDPESRRPHCFLTLPDEPRRELWLRGVHRFAAARAWASALIVEHALRIHEPRHGEPGWYEFLSELTELKAELVAAGGGERVLAEDYRWLDLADGLSLTACGMGAEVERAGYRARLEGSELHVEPFPLAGSTRFEIPARTLPARDYAGDADLGGELAAARWGEITVRVVPW